MSVNFKQLLYWAPRALGILYTGALGLGALLMIPLWGWSMDLLEAIPWILAPMFVMVIALLIAWRWELAGAALFAGLAELFLVWTGWEKHWDYFLHPGPLALLGALFLLNWTYGKRLRVQ